MDHKDLCEHTRIRLIAAAVGLQQCAKTASNIVPIPGGDRVIAIGTPAQVRALLPKPEMPPELKAAIEEAAKTRAPGAVLPDGSAVFINYGDQPEDTTDISCTACGGSGHVDDQSRAARDVLAERRRQVDVEGMTNGGDDRYYAAELPRAAASYILNGANDEAPYIWPWAKTWWKPRDARANYVRAAALLLAEIERIDRAAMATPPSSEKDGATTLSLTSCAAGRDGECGHAQCPQLLEGEPRATGRHCPLDIVEDDE